MAFRNRAIQGRGLGRLLTSTATDEREEEVGVARELRGNLELCDSVRKALCNLFRARNIPRRAMERPKTIM